MTENLKNHGTAETEPTQTESMPSQPSRLKQLVTKLGHEIATHGLTIDELGSADGDFVEPASN